jgi:hypothetical protein
MEAVGLFGPGVIRRAAARARVRLPRPNWRGHGLVFVAITWVPLALLTLIQGTFAGEGWVFGRDAGSYSRFLFAGPLLFAMGPVFERELGTAVEALRGSELVPSERRAAFDHFLGRLEALRRSALPAVVIVLLAGALTVVALEARSDRGFQPWLFRGTPVPLSPAGWWYALVAGPAFYVVLLQALWRFVLWTAVLARLASLPARSFGTHADGVGGLGGVARAHNMCATLMLALSAMAAGSLANDIFYGGVTVELLRREEIVVVVLLLAIFLAPLLLFVPQLLAARRRANTRYGAVAAHHAAYLEGEIDDRLAADQTTRPLLPSQLLEDDANLAQSFVTVRDMRTFPLSKQSFIMWVACAVGPLLLLELTEVPLRDLVERMKNLLL